MKSRTSLSKRQRRNAFKIGFLYFQDTNVIIKLDDDGNIIENIKNKKKISSQENSSANYNSQKGSSNSTPLTNLNATHDNELSFQDDINLLCDDIEFEIINDIENIDGLDFSLD